jgi:hypothetical protein
MKIRIKQDVELPRAKARRYPPHHRAFLSEIVSELEQNGFVRRNPNACCSSPALVVSKLGKHGFRMTVDLRAVNAITILSSWPMPIFEVVMAHLSGATRFAVLDAFKGYWQFPVDPDCQEYLSFMTHDGVFTSDRVIQGSTDAVDHFQAGMQEAIGNELLYSSVLIWIDDLLVKAKSDDDLVQALRKVFERLRLFGIKLNATRCVLYTTEAKWCGRTISERGVAYDRAMIEGLVALPLPVTAADLQKFVCGLSWMRTSIPRFSTIIAPLQD